MHVSPSWLGCSTIQCTTSRYKVSISGASGKRKGGGGVIKVVWAVLALLHLVVLCGRGRGAEHETIEDDHPVLRLHTSQKLGGPCTAVASENRGGGGANTKSGMANDWRRKITCVIPEGITGSERDSHNRSVGQANSRLTSTQSVGQAHSPWTGLPAMRDP